MKNHRKLVLSAIASIGLALASCAQMAPLEVQIDGQLVQADPGLRGTRFSVLVNFENEKDADLVVGEPLGGVIDSAHPHTGTKSLALGEKTQRLAVQLNPVLETKPFPADWSLAGGYFYCEHDVGALVSYLVNGKTIAQNDTILRGGQWTAAMVDLTAGGDAVPPGGQIVFEFPAGDPGRMWCDDLLLVNNDQMLFGAAGQDPTAGTWTIRRQGFNIIVERPGGWKKTLRTPEATVDGWKLVDANALRARFESQGSTHYLTMYADGRQYEGGAYVGQWVSDDPWRDLYARCHVTPAEISLATDQGRLDRNTPGDSRNTGYNERLGSYELVAFGRHLEVKIAPTDAAVARPVFEIVGLPEGKVLATLEGELIEQYVRLPDGRLLIELPAKILRPSVLNIRVE